MEQWEFDAQHLCMDAHNAALMQVRPLVQAGALADAAREIREWCVRINGEVQDASAARIIDWLEQRAKELRDSRHLVYYEARTMDSPVRRAAMVGVHLDEETRSLPTYSDDSRASREQRRYVTEWVDGPPLRIREQNDTDRIIAAETAARRRDRGVVS